MDSVQLIIIASTRTAPLTGRTPLSSLLRFTNKKQGMVMAVIRRVSSALVIALALLATSVAAPAQEKIRLGLIPISEALGAVIADARFLQSRGS